MEGKSLFKSIFLGIFLILYFFSVGSYAIPPVGTRTFNFVNNCSYPVWFGLAGGSVTSKLSGTQCNSNADCYSGASCIQTGNIKQCFWNNPQPTNGNYQLSANGGTNKVTIPMYNEGLNAVWSGVIAGRTACTGSSCQTADCGNGNQACIPGRGFSQPATQAEFTLALKGNDFYDVEVINGVNIPIEMTPILTASARKTKVAADPYNCGNPGGSKPSSALLGACSWKFTPPSNDYRWVQNGGNTCSADSDCQGGTMCGISFNPGNTPLLKKTCGNLIGYWTADQICGIQRDYGAPFNCSQKLPAPQNNLTWWNLYACVGVGSCYQNGAGSDCCGCVNWDKVGVPVPPAPYTNQCVNQNTNWVNNVQSKLAWLKQACPTAYVYPYDDMSSTFVCNIPQNNINTANYTITYCPNGETTPPTTFYSYTVYVGFPFSPVVINNKITCPDPVSHSPACAVKNQATGTQMVITGKDNHVCNLSILANGNVSVNAGSSNYCYINSSPATPTSSGSVALPSGF